jgi:hypothetical protein
MYLSNEEREKLNSYCLNYRPYKYIKSINYANKHKTDTKEDYLGVLVLPTLYTSQCTKEETDSGTGLFYADVHIIRHYSYEACNAYLHSRRTKNTVLAKPNSPGLHTLFIVKEIAYIVLQFMDLIFTIDDPKLVKVYQSRKGFGDRITKLSLDDDGKYRVLKTING